MSTLAAPETRTPYLVTSADVSWDDARSAWNLSVDQRPAAVALPESAEEVAAIVRYAVENGLRIAPQGTGHGAAALGDLEGTILLRTSRMRTVTIDPVARIARAEAGAEWQDVTRPAAEHGLAALAGSSPDVGIAGYTLGGGVGWLARKHGLATNSIVALEVVTADGALRRIDAENDADLFWALRGGGGGFAIVTAIELALLPVAELYAGAMFWPVARAGEILQAWRRFTATAPDEVTSVGRILQFPPFPQVPEALRGKSFVLVEAAVLGSAETGEKLLAPLRALEPAIDTFDTIPAVELQKLHMDPDGPSPGVGNGMLLADLDAEAVDALLAVAGPGSRSPFVSLELRHLGGELGRSRPGNGALASIDAGYALYAVGVPFSPEDRAAVELRFDALRQKLAPWDANRSYMNFTDSRVDARRFWSDEAYERLLAVKATVDPDDAIRPSHPLV